MTAKQCIQRILLVLGIGVLLPIAGYSTYVYVASERYLADVELSSNYRYIDQQDPQQVEKGRLIARTRGCFGCHGQQLEGRVFSEEWVWVGTAVAPNLAQYAQEHEPIVIEAAVRQGIGQDGRALWSMPSYNFALMNDDDISALIAYLRSAPVTPKSLPEPDLGWEVRSLIVRGKRHHMAEWVARMPPLVLSEEDETQLARGEYIAKTTCNECHGFDLRGDVAPDFTTPDLAMVVAYPDKDFRRLMKTGVGIGERDLGLMTMVAKDRFAYFTDNQLSDLLAYLRSLPGSPIDQDASWRSLQ